jgi:hypothetical protein
MSLFLICSQLLLLEIHRRLNVYTNCDERLGQCPFDQGCRAIKLLRKGFCDGVFERRELLIELGDNRLLSSFNFSQKLAVIFLDILLERL